MSPEVEIYTTCRSANVSPGQYIEVWATIKNTGTVDLPRGFFVLSVAAGAGAWCSFESTSSVPPGGTRTFICQFTDGVPSDWAGRSIDWIVEVWRSKADWEAGDYSQRWASAKCYGLLNVSSTGYSVSIESMEARA
ncbi:MAG: hypothetical protein DRP12_00110 [Candidatus Aenigmatarchaeota archaeon]|nr:MAG: hypothetical protein DRP12_00110 [Candidatus Aenigmarchaeota archaeon]